MSGLARRLDRVETTRPLRRTPSWQHPFDSDRLSMEEMAELERLLIVAPGGLELDALNDEQFDRMATLIFLGHGREWTET